MQQSKNRQLSLLFSFLGYSIFGFSFLFSKKALEVSTPLVLLAVRFSAAFLLLNLLLLTKKFKLRLKGKNVKMLLLLGVFQPVMYFICENYGVTLTPTSFVGTILSLVPIASIVFGRIFLKEKVLFLQIVFSLISVIGVFFTTVGQKSGMFSWLGFILLLGSVCAAALFNVISRKTSEEFTAFERTYLMFALGCVTFISLSVAENGTMLPAMLSTAFSCGDFWISIVFLAGVSSVGAFLMINYAMTHLDVAKASIFANVTTVISILAGVILLKEPFEIFQAIGSALIIGGVYGVNKSASVQPNPDQTEISKKNI